MVSISTVTARDILRDYKSVFDNVRKTKKPAVVISRKEPQVAIVSLDDLEELQKLHNKRSAKSLLDFANEARSLLKEEKLPKDLATNHDKYLLGE